MDTQGTTELNGMLADAGLDLVREGGALVLACGRMKVKGDFSHMAERTRVHALGRELLVRAAKVKTADARPFAVDATAGLGDDSFLLAAAGFDVLMFERNPVIAALLSDALERAAADPALAGITAHMRLECADSTHALAHLDRPVDVVLLDPMFPERRKSASVKKKLQLLQRLETPCDDERALIAAAFGAHPRKVLVKRPAKGPHLAGIAPNHAIEGKAVRYDCYIPDAMRQDRLPASP